MSKNNVKITMINHIASTLGVDADDVNSEDRFKEDLHMSPSDLSDFIHSLEDIGFSVDPEDSTEFETVGELIEYVSENEGV